VDGIDLQIKYQKGAPIAHIADDSGPPLAVGSRQVSVRRIERNRPRRAVTGTNSANGRRRIEDSLAVVIVVSGSHS
jgi:hypothetical protein